MLRRDRTIMEKILTIITPTYNRAHTLKMCYESLLNQTIDNFEWMIIDDGSTDNTEFLVKQWINEAKIIIKYYKKVNGGKASALNYAFKKINTKYLVCLDSDDTFSKKAIELTINKLIEIENDNECCGILALRTAIDGKVLGGRPIPSGVERIKRQDIENKYKINSELICFYKSEIICNFTFPSIPNEKFISPAYLEYEVSREYYFRVSQDVLCYCEYYADGLTKNKNRIIKQNPIGYTIVKKQSYELSNNIILKAKHCMMYICGSMLAKQKNIITNSPNKLMTIMFYPLGWLIYIFKYKLNY